MRILKNDPSGSRFFYLWMGIALLLHILGVFFSSGFYHADEHFQIAEFLNFKLGRSLESDLPLEFGFHLRPWLLPAFFWSVTKGLIAIGVTNPLHWATVYRFISSLFGWFSTIGLSLCSYTWFSNPKWRKFAVIATVLLWYMPSFHARHSSENWGGSLFFIGLSLGVLSLNAKRFLSFQTLFGIGLFFGLAFEMRYQVAFMIVGALLWLIVFAQVRFQHLLHILLGMIISVAVGTLADRWGYGEWTFAPWNYLNYNIIQNHVADVDTSPWWDYFRRAATESWPLLGLLVLLSFPIAWIRNPKHILTWSAVPFFLVHEIIGHKELRFLFPLIHAGGIFLALSFETRSTEPFRKSLKGLWIALLSLNLVALIALTFTPAWMPIRFYQRLYEFKPEGFKLYMQDDSLYVLGGTVLNFYRPPQVTFIRVQQYPEFTSIVEKSPEPQWLFYSRFELPDSAGVLKEWCKPEFSTLPQWLERLPIRKKLNQVTNWTLFRCRKLTGTRILRSV